MTFEHGAVVDDDILRWLAPATSFGILAWFEANGIVTYIKGRIDDERILTGLQVESIAILGIAGIPHEDVVDDDILT